MKSLDVLIEKSDGSVGARIEEPGSFVLTSQGSSVAEVADNLRDLVADFLANEGKDHPDWVGIIEPDVLYLYHYE